jgi:hypothetical protein
MDWQLLMDWIVLLPAVSCALLILSYFLLFPRTLAEVIELFRSGSVIPVKFRKRFVIAAACAVVGMAGQMATFWWVAGHRAIFFFAMVLFLFIAFCLRLICIDFESMKTWSRSHTLWSSHSSFSGLPFPKLPGIVRPRPLKSAVGQSHRTKAANSFARCPLYLQ